MDPHAGTSLAVAPDWAQWLGSFGSGSVWAATGLFAVAVLLSIFRPAGRLAAWSFALGCVALLSAFGSLTALFVTNQFQFKYVWAHAESVTSIQYKVAGVWSGQEGSFLLWACASAIFGLATLRSVGHYRRWYVAVYAGFLGALGAILAYESPFLLHDQAIQGGRVLVPPDGVGLVPALQNYWVVIHPPIIFLGFGSLTVMFCWAAAAMATKNATDWVRPIRPWAILSISILGLGICLGGFWAYETLGWGGFWAWDPVENASFVPWLLGVAFVHGLIVQASRGRWAGTNLLLAGLPFLAFVYGTFLTRSGFLTDVSVHSFAEMNRSALQILLGLMGVTTGGFLALWLWRGRRIAVAQSAEPHPGLHREAAYRWGALMLAFLGLAIALGMSVPLFQSLAAKSSKVVNEGLYHMVVVWFFVPIMVLVAIAPFLSWRGMGAKALLTRLSNVAALSLGLLGVSIFLIKIAGWNVPLASKPEENFGSIALPFGARMPAMAWLAVLLLICLFAAVANTMRSIELLKRAKPLSIGGLVSHVGIAVFMAGMVLSRGFEQKEFALIQPGVTSRALAYNIAFVDFEGRPGAKDVLTDPATKAVFEVEGAGMKYRAKPSLYYDFQNGEQQAVTWPHILRSPGRDLYFAVGAPEYMTWKEPVQFKVGETKTINGIKATYLKMERVGQPGQQGTKFAAKMHLETPNGDFHASPGIAVGAQPELAPAGPYFVSMLGMDAATNAATLQVFYRNPIFPVELHHKPMTLLVWVGAGILALGGLMSALYRRTAPAQSVSADQDSDASLPAT